MKYVTGLCAMIVASAMATLCQAQPLAYSPQCEAMRREHLMLYQAEVNYAAADEPLREAVATARGFAPVAQAATDANLASVLDSIRKQLENARKMRADATDPGASEGMLYNIRALEIVQDYISDIIVRRAAGDSTAGLQRDYDEQLSDLLTPIGRMADKSVRARTERLGVEGRMRLINCPTMIAMAAPVDPEPRYQEPAPAVAVGETSIAGLWTTSLGDMTISNNPPSFSAVTVDGFVTIDGRIEGNEVVGTYSVRAAGLAPGAPYAIMDACPRAEMGSRVWGTITAGLIKDAQGNVTGFDGVFDYCGVRGEGVTLQRFNGTRQTTGVR